MLILYNINGVDSTLWTKVLRTRSVIGRRKFMFQAGGLYMYKKIYYKVLTHMIMGVESLIIYYLQIVWRLRRWRVDGVLIDPNPYVKVWGPEISRARDDWYPSLQVWEWISLSSAFLFYSGTKWIGWCPSAWEKAICFTQSTIPNASLFWKLRHTQD